jgi:nitrogen fixation NifU-like protein
MDEIRELYQATILDHNRKPRNFRPLESATRRADGHNPLCGDKLTVYLQTDDDGHVVDASFQGSGCAISTASASLLTEFVKGKSVDEINQTFERFHSMVTTSAANEPDTDGLGKLAVFSGVREFPMRVKCATLSWHTLRSALEDDHETAKTE